MQYNYIEILNGADLNSVSLMKYDATVGHLNTYDYSIQVVIELIRIHTGFGPKKRMVGNSYTWAGLHQDCVY